VGYLGSVRIKILTRRLAGVRDAVHLTAAFLHSSVALHRITESQNVRSWKGPLWVI